MPTKISTVAKELNVGVATLLEHLEKKNMPAEQNSPNARITDEQKEILMKEFCKDYDEKKIADNMAEDRHKGKEKNSDKQGAGKVTSADDLTTTVQRPKIIGKIDLSTGKMQTPEKPKTEEKPQPKVESKVDVKEASAPQQPQSTATAPQPKLEPEKEVKPEEPKPQAPKVEEKPAEKPQTPKEQPEKPIVEDTPNAADDDDQNDAESSNNISLIPNKENITNIKLVGKIDLSQINQQTRPKKKTKEEKRNERMAKSNNNRQDHQFSGDANGEGNRKKR